MKKLSYLFIISGLVFFAAFLALAEETDTTAPADVVDLTTTIKTQTTITLSWTSPGDDGSVGTSTSYTLRYATSTIDDSNWAQASDVDNEPTPQVASSTETMTVSGLVHSATYYFALKTKDGDNESNLSNVASAVTLAPPAVCGNNDVETGEECDDGNVEGDDGCSVTCEIEEEADEPEADVEIEVKVTPRSLNLSSQGNWISVNLYLPSPYKATQVDLSSVKLNGSLSPDGDFKGFNRFNKGNSDKEKKYSSLLMKFSRAEVIGLVGSTTGNFVITITGQVGAETFSASDTIKVLLSTSIDDDDEDEDEDEDGDDEDDEEGDDENDDGDETLIQAEGENEVYVIKNNKRRHIPSVQAFNRHNYNWSRIKKVSKDEVDSYEDDELLRSENQPEVFIIVAGMRRHIPNEEVFEAYGFDWADISIVPADDIGDYEEVRLIRRAGNDKVYLLSGGKRHWIPTAAVFNSKGYKWANIIIVNQTEEEATEEGTAVE